MLAGRVALALDNAGLSSEVEALEAQLSAGLGSLAEAVTIQDRQGRLVYANEAAERALGFTTTEELLATPPQEIVDAYDSFHGVVDAVGEAGRFGERRLAEALRGARGRPAWSPGSTRRCARSSAASRPTTPPSSPSSGSPNAGRCGRGGG